VAEGLADEGVREQQEPSAWALRLRRFGYAQGDRTDTRERLVPPFPEPGAGVWGMLGLGPATARLMAKWSGCADLIAISDGFPTMAR